MLAQYVRLNVINFLKRSTFERPIGRKVTRSYGIGDLGLSFRSDQIPWNAAIIARQRYDILKG